ncbi:MAG: hypothetical protein DWH91_06995 [Planctomycetota bacterium]|nr:MAG: hypothetical protein DWH91_06995 [Planctomycetota bacterium]
MSARSIENSGPANQLERVRSRWLVFMNRIRMGDETLGPIQRYSPSGQACLRERRTSESDISVSLQTEVHF